MSFQTGLSRIGWVIQHGIRNGFSLRYQQTLGCKNTVFIRKVLNLPAGSQSLYLLNMETILAYLKKFRWVLLLTGLGPLCFGLILTGLHNSELAKQAEIQQFLKAEMVPLEKKTAPIADLSELKDRLFDRMSIVDRLVYSSRGNFLLFEFVFVEQPGISLQDMLVKQGEISLYGTATDFNSLVAYKNRFTDLILCDRQSIRLDTREVSGGFVLSCRSGKGRKR